MQVSLRRAGTGDVEHIKWALYHALAWNAERAEIVRHATLDHPEAARYHHDWGRRGDGGVIATASDDVVGVAYFRLFTAEDHGHGYVDDDTPELAVAVRGDCRGRGLGTRLLHELAELARAMGFARLSLSVDSDNPARRLYERLGFGTLSVDDDGMRMVCEVETLTTASELDSRSTSLAPART